MLQQVTAEVEPRLAAQVNSAVSLDKKTFSWHNNDAASVAVHLIPAAT